MANTATNARTETASRKVTRTSGSRRHLTRGVILLLRRMIRRLMTSRSAVGPVEQCLRGALMIPLFSLYYLIARWCAWRGRTIEFDTVTHFGTKMRCRPPDLIQMYLHIFGVWEPDVAAFIERRLRPRDVMIDIGANVGALSLLAARRVKPEGRVFAIEPAPEIVRQLRVHIEQNPDAPVTAIASAVAPQRGTVTLYAGPAHNLGLTSTLQHRHMKPAGEIEAAPLDELIDAETLRCARLIKIDVEGGEADMLAHLAGLIDCLAPDVEILVELSPAWWTDRSLLPRAVIKPFLDAGFHPYRIENNYWPWRYLWPDCVTPPRRIRHDLSERVGRIDLVLSREDRESL